MRRFRNSLLFLGSIGVSLVIVEAGARLLFPEHNPSGRLVFYYDDHEHYAHGQINSTFQHINRLGEFDVEVVFNKFGFRDRKDISKASNDVAMLGDSFAMGWGVGEEDRFSNIIEREKGLRVFNIASPTDIEGYDEMLDFAQRQNASFSKLIISICMENDIHNYATGEQGYHNSRQSFLGRTKEFLVRRSTTYNVIVALVHSSEMLSGLSEELGLIEHSLDQLNRSKYSHATLDSSIGRLVELTDKSGFDVNRTSILIIPSRSLWIGTHKDVEIRVHDEFVEGLNRAGFEVIDMKKALEKRGRPLDYFFENDGHWNVDGHRLAADKILEGASLPVASY